MKTSAEYTAQMRVLQVVICIGLVIMGALNITTCVLARQNTAALIRCQEENRP